MKTKLWLFILAFGLIFTACEKDDEFKGGPPAGKGRVVADLSEPCEINGETPLIAGQHHKVGTVRVEKVEKLVLEQKFEEALNMTLLKR